MAPSRPGDFGWQRHQDRLDIAAGLEAEQRAAVVEQVELDITAASDELVTALLRRPRLEHVPADQHRVDGEEGFADIVGEGEVALPAAAVAAAVEIVEEDAADAARLVAVLEEEILIAPFLEALVVVGIVRIARGLERGMKITRIGFVREHRGEIGAAAEPSFAGDDMARVHVHGGNQRRGHMGDQRDAARPEARVFGGAGDLAAELGRELTEDGRDVDADFLEDLTLHHGHDATAAAITVALGGALPRLAREAAG